MRVKRIIAAAIGSAMVLMPVTVRAEPVPMHLTCYCPESCPGTTTYTGAHVREGIAAVSTEHIGDGALIWTVDGEYLGYWECLDKIGTGKSTVIDIWEPDLDTAKAMMEKTGGRVMVSWIKRE